MKEQEFYKSIADIFNHHFSKNINDDIKEFATNYIDEYYKENGSTDMIAIWSDSLEGVIEEEFDKLTDKVRDVWNEYIEGKDPKDIPVRLDGEPSIFLDQSVLFSLYLRAAVVVSHTQPPILP